MIRAKEGIDTSKLSDEIWRALASIEDLFSPKDLIITSTYDGKHIPGSFHYKNKAVDIRSREFDETEARSIQSRVRQVLGSDYDFIWEPNAPGGAHFHLEYDPKTSNKQTVPNSGSSPNRGVPDTSPTIDTSPIKKQTAISLTLLIAFVVIVFLLVR